MNLMLLAKRESHSTYQYSIQENTLCTHLWDRTCEGIGACMTEKQRTELMEWMSHRKRRGNKQQPSMLPLPAGPGCCLVSFHFLCDIHYIQSVAVTNLLDSYAAELVPSLPLRDGARF